MNSDKRINKTVKQLMNKEPFKLVGSFEEADIILMFDRDISHKYNIIMKEEYCKNLLNSLPPNDKLVYFKSTNPHNRRLTSIGFIKRVCTEH